MLEYLLLFLFNKYNYIILFSPYNKTAFKIIYNIYKEILIFFSDNNNMVFICFCP